ncbi:protein kinase [Haloferula chungangensis]|uniref:Protein kinase n=1 Tax=Haloferula chungangensis TaxID=1048331 RepID=A0ABW2L2P7_9BACT
MTHSPTTCPDCGAAFSADSPQQLCPTCLLKQAFASRTVDQPLSELSPPPSPEEIADSFPQFEVTECLGRGGMGVVYKARQKSLNRWVAIKVLAPEKIDDEKFAERFAREARTLAQLNHPNIVTVHDYGETDGLYYIVMEFVDGVNLRDLLRDGKIESTQALTIVPPICEALQYAHDKGIVHRDIKPENLLIDREGRVKIADFGIASLVGTTGESSGTPPYMAPEQGAHSHVDHRADIYALGAVLYEMLTGDRPSSPLDLPSQKVQLDIRIDDIVLRALSKEPKRRYRTANEFRSVVETFSTCYPPSISSPLGKQTTSPQFVSINKQGMFRRWWWILLLMILSTPWLFEFGTRTYLYLAPKFYSASAIIQFSGDAATKPSDAIAKELASPNHLRAVSKDLELESRWALSEAKTLQRLDTMISIRPSSEAGTCQIEINSDELGIPTLMIDTLLRSFEGDPRLSPFETISLSSNGSTPQADFGELRTFSRYFFPLIFGLLAVFIMALLQRLFPEKIPTLNDRSGRDTSLPNP